MNPTNQPGVARRGRRPRVSRGADELWLSASVVALFGAVPEALVSAATSPGEGGVQ